MFFAQGKGLEESMKNVAGYTKLADVNVKNLVTTLADSITNVRGNLDTAFEIQQRTANTIRQTLGQTRVVSNQVMDVLAQASKSTNLIGINAEKNIEFYCVDTWEGGEDHKNDETFSKELETLYEVFLKNIYSRRKR
jgi:hypothetical protein